VPATRPFPLVATLLLRACVNGVFAVWLFARAPVWIDIFWAGANYALVDGALGLITFVLLVRHEPLSAPPQLVSMIVADAVLRLGAGAAIHALPGIPYFPIALVLFYGALGTWAATAGVIAMAAWFVAHGHRKDAGRPRPWTHALFDPFAGAGLIAIVLAVYAFAVGPPATAEALRTATGAASATLALVFLVAAFGAASIPSERAAT